MTKWKVICCYWFLIISMWEEKGPVNDSLENVDYCSCCVTVYTLCSFRCHVGRRAKSIGPPAIYNPSSMRAEIHPGKFLAVTLSIMIWTKCFLAVTEGFPVISKKAIVP
ncbi:MAG: hypothetical protein ACP5U1_10925 [Desulfomonilaceae bacterium]